MILNRLKEALKKSSDPAMTLSGFVKSADCIKHRDPTLYAGILKSAVGFVGKDYLVECYLDKAWPRDIEALQKEAGVKVTRAQILTHIGHDLGEFLEKHAHSINKKLFSEVIPELKKEAYTLAEVAASNLMNIPTALVVSPLAGALGADDSAKGFQAGVRKGMEIASRNIGATGTGLAVNLLGDALKSDTLSQAGGVGMMGGTLASLASPLEGAVRGYLAGKATSELKKESGLDQLSGLGMLLGPLISAAGGSVGGGIAGALTADDGAEGFKAGFSAGAKSGLTNAALIVGGLSAGEALKVSGGPSLNLPGSGAVTTHAALSPLEGMVRGYLAAKELNKDASMDAIVHRSKLKIQGKPTVAQKLQTNPMQPQQPQQQMQKLAEILEQKMAQKKKYL